VPTALVRPGDVIEVSSIVADVNAGVLFLGLAGEEKKGWVSPFRSIQLLLLNDIWSIRSCT
jgi:hypothetical protein